MSKIIGLTGGICSGKSTISKIFSKFPKVFIIDSDIISKKITQPGNIAFYTILKHFGNNVISSNGSLNRFILRKKVFSNPKNINWINKLLHPLIHQYVQKEIKKNLFKSSYILWVSPLLIENNLQKFVNRILVIDVNPKIQLKRILNRDGNNIKNAKRIIQSQTSQKNRLNFANDVIENNGDYKKIEKKIYNLHKIYIK